MMKFKPNLLSLLVPFLSVFIVACSDSYEDETVYSGTEDFNVDLTVSLQNQDINTRSFADDHYISLGKEIDCLYFAVYEETKDANNNVAYVRSAGFETNITYDMSSRTWPVNIKLSLNQEKKYKAVFWAQSSKCTAYDAKDLTDIKVKYLKEDNTKYLNNDETRDAFAACLPITGKGNHSVVLHRVLAQINIGTTGADYANLIYDEAMLPHGLRMNQSTISIEGVADTYNALTGVASSSKDKTGSANVNEKITAEFDWADLPAWINLTKNPEFGEYTKDTDPFVETENEEFLIVDIDREDGGFQPYKTEYPTINRVQDIWGAPGTEYLTETFKYLSMCYVLVPTVKDENEEETGTTVKLTFNFQQDKGGSETPISLTAKTITNVPVRANFRTNILGGLYTTDDVPDPTSIFLYNAFSVILQDNYDYHYVIKWENPSEETNGEESTN